MNIHDHIQLWNQANVRVLDVRHNVLEAGERLPRYIFPVSAFVYAARGRGRLWLDGEVHYADRFHILHGGKGASMEIESETIFEYYLILYKAVLPQNCLYEFQMLLQSDNPFEQPFGFAPHDALELLEFVQCMHRDWSQTNGLDKLQVRGVFYQFVHRLLRQMQQSPEAISQHSLTEQVLRFLSEHYQETKSIESLSLQLNYSPQYLSRKFKEQTGLSPIEYIIKLRMEKAQRLLITTDATLQEIASSVGYPDLFYFNRMFKKYAGIAPGQFRNKHLPRQDQNSTYTNHTKKALKNSIVNQSSQIYTNYDNENHYQNVEKGDYTMYKGSNKVILSTLWLCFTIILSACAAGSDAPASSQSSQVTPSSTDAAQPSQTKVVSTLFGEVNVPLEPKRVVAVDYLGTVIALGIKPIGSSEMLIKSPYLDGQLADVEEIGDSFEKLLTMEPDLIITHTTKQEVYDKYSQIAPTVSVASNTFNSVHEELTYFGDVLGKETEAAEWLRQYDNQIAMAKTKVEEVLPKDATFSVFQEYDGQVFVFGAKSGRGGRIIYQALGLHAPAALPDKVMEVTYSETSLEKLPEYAGDYIVLTTESSLEELQKDPIWGSLKAVREGRIYLWGEDRSWYRDPIALLSQTKALTDWIVGLSQQK
ncbi:AraC family transcriptional regulator [Paenibacillus eucommiae]|uniref:Iron complex transport system substrate-binding protein n=1 Tax=Paenibacillus eucommiae TaxID=1355755 RepID=A0ABS4IPZ3_9BACL|nr:AraC family transcriptional regulator [Paenibacillus eucommiae]MBP1989647.1 iron complex transport system substrate-binding protein [Paenibacillus eucommiae]